MKTKEQIEQEFRADLNALLIKYRAEIDMEERGGGNWQRGLDYIIICCDAKHHEETGECLEEYTTIDLGRHVNPKY